VNALYSVGGYFEPAPGFGRTVRVSGRLKSREAWLVPNIARRGAFVVDGFHSAYQSRSFPVSCGSILHNVLGPPTDEERIDTQSSNRWIQHFENGTLTWDCTSGFIVDLAPGVADAVRSIRNRWSEVWHTRGPLDRIGGGYGRRVTGGDLRYGDAWLVANPKLGSAFFIKHELRRAYDSCIFPESKLHPLHELLGLPCSDEMADSTRPGTIVQRFDRGTLEWSKAAGVRVAVG
jgi:hypothetical protein